MGKSFAPMYIEKKKMSKRQNYTSDRFSHRKNYIHGPGLEENREK